jgi:hypothetical protein
MTKTYTVESSSINETGGRYVSKTPSSAARKAATKLFKKASNSGKITFCLRETTVDSKKKEFHYVATRVKLAKPLVRVINGVEIVNRFKTEVKAVKDKKTTKPRSPKPAKKTAKKSAKSAKSPKSPKSPKKTKRAKKVKGGDCGCDN